MDLDALAGPEAAALLALASFPVLTLISALMFGREEAAAAAGPVIRTIDWISNQAFLWIRWLALWLVLVQFAVVVLRYVFGLGFIFLQESLLYFHGTLFLIAAAGALLHEGHVRIDVFYRDASPWRKALIDFVGSYVFLFPVIAVITAVSVPYVASSWAVFEGSKETSGIHGVFLLKSMILAFCAFVFAQGISFAARAALVLAGAEPPAKPQGPTVIA